MEMLQHYLSEYVGGERAMGCAVTRVENPGGLGHLHHPHKARAWLFLLWGLFVCGVGPVSTMVAQSPAAGVLRMERILSEGIGRIWRPHPSRLWVGALEAWCGVEVKEKEGQSPRKYVVETGMLCRFPGLRYERLPTLTQMRRYFEEALGERAVPEGRNVFGFERRQVFEWGGSCRSARLSEEDGWVRVQWCANDDFGLSELREFFEAPFFMKAETECFYRWLGVGGWQQSFFRGQEIRMGVLATLTGFYVEIRWRVGRGLM